MGSLGGWEIVIILVVLVLLFGAKRLPDMARSIGQSARVLKGEMKGMKSEDDAAPAPKPAPSPAPTAELPAPSPTQSSAPEAAAQEPQTRPGQ